MSDNTGNIEFLVAKVKAIEKVLTATQDKRLDAFTSLLSSIETGVAELIENIEMGGGAQAIEAMAKALGSIKMPEVNFTAPTINVEPTPITVNVPQQAAPTVTVEAPQITVEAVMPTAAVPVIHVMPAPEQKGATWEIRIPQPYGADKVMVIKRTS